MAQEVQIMGSERVATMNLTAIETPLMLEVPEADDTVQFYKSVFGAVEAGRNVYCKRKAEPELPHILSDQLELAASAEIADNSPRLKPMTASKETIQYSTADLNLFTNYFSNDNFIGKFQYGKVYRGKIGNRDVTVNVWSETKLYSCRPGENKARIEAELILHTDSRIKSHPNLAKLFGYCCEGQLAVVYDLNPVDTLQTFILRDDFNWRQRIKIALQLACLLKFLHTPCHPQLPYLVRNIDAAHFLLDQDYNLVLYDFGMFTGGVLPDTRNIDGRREFGCYGYIDPCLFRRVKWHPESDVWAFGVILIGLLAKMVYIADESLAIGFAAPDGVFVDEWASEEYERSGDTVSLVHKSMEVDSDFEYDDAQEITKLGMHCLEFWYYERPQMDEVVERLLKLNILSRNLKLCEAD